MAVARPPRRPAGRAVALRSVDDSPRSGHGGRGREAPDRQSEEFLAVRRVLRAGGPQVVFQPQLSLSRLEVAGYEALARFPGQVNQHPEHWFGRAHDVGLGPAMEACALSTALRRADERPPGTTLAVNVSPSVLGTPALRAVLPHDLTGVEIELTEHEVVLDPDGLRREVDRLRDRGARLAIDDIGAGHSGLRRVMELAPDTLKLDRHLVEGVAGNTAKAALIRAVVEFADHIGATVCAEGVEDVADLLALADLDVAFAQGWVVGAPADTFLPVADDVVAAGRRSMERVLRTPPAPFWDGTSSMPAEAGGPAAIETLVTLLADVRSLPSLARLARSGARALGCDRVELSLLHPDGLVVEALLVDDDDDEPVPYLLADFPLTRRCLEEHRVVPVHRGDRGSAAERALLDELGFAGVLLVPVSSRGRAVGLLECYLRDDIPWSRRHIRTARLMASVLGPVLDSLAALQPSRPAPPAPRGGAWRRADDPATR